MSMPSPGAAELAQPTAATPGGVGTVSVTYLGRPGLFGLLVKNLLLKIVTLGIYRFWARTAVRRYFWSNVAIVGEPLEYTGRGIELFLGFLIVLAILIPLVSLLAVLRQLAASSPAALTIFEVLNVLVFVSLIQAAIFRARRYRLSRTLWRGIRAGQTGSTWHYILLSLLYGLLSVVTLGLAVPWASVALQRYLMTNTRFGDSSFAFEASGRRLLLRWLVVMAAGAALLGSAIALVGVVQVGAKPAGGAVPGLIVLAGVAFAALLFLASVWYRIGALRYFVACARLGDIRFGSTARTGAIVGIVLIFALLVVTLAVASVAIAFGTSVLFVFGALGVGAARNQAAISAFGGQIGPFVMIVAVALFLLGYNLLSTWWLKARVIRHLCSTIEIADVGAADAIVQSSLPVRKFGEGLADSFDVGAI